ncbi:MAG: hypothetical protein N2112_06430, partial [Gemmataceae bacterium]|nr:hypothetical protein [Gemmataceae bacterium]
MLVLRRCLFAAVIVAVAPFVALAEDKPAEKGPAPAPITATAPGGCGGTVIAPGGTVAPGAGAGCYVTVTKLVPTQVQETRTVMKPVQKTETYTAYRYETVQETQVVPVTTYKHVTETVMEPRTTTVKVPVVETRTVMETRKKIEYVTECKEKCTLTFSKECKQIGCGDCGVGIPFIKPGFQKVTVPVT